DLIVETQHGKNRTAQSITPDETLPSDSTESSSQKAFENKLIHT
ncbi:unnamed protein product, partial [Didymodactylos carnosus]